MNGYDVLQNAIQTAPQTSGVYKMYDKSHILIYIGKAKNIKNRLLSYTKEDTSPKTHALVQSIASIEFEITHTERQALILEASLVKQHQPKFNILLKDDKSRLYIKISNHAIPAITTHRGKFDRKSHLFGPFGYIQGSALSASQTIKGIMDFTCKVFKLRSCKDTKLKVHQSMGKPCMEFQIGTCSAPCVGNISNKQYQASVQDAISFLNGGYLSFQRQIKEKIQNHAKNHEFMEAGYLKNQLLAIERLRSYTDVDFQRHENLDIIAINESLDAVEVFAIRNGYALGGNVFEIYKQEEKQAPQIIEDFVYQYYSKENPPPKTIFTNYEVNATNVKTVLQHLTGVVCVVFNPKKGENKTLVDFVMANLLHQITTQTNDKKLFLHGMELLQKEFELQFTPQRVEVYDNSHTGGTFFIGAFIVVSQGGFEGSQYRKFNAKFTKGGDDYGMMVEVMQRRFGEYSKMTTMPDVILIDGGFGQFNAVQNILTRMNISIPVIAIAKGEDRNAGNETFFTKNRKNFKISDQSLLYFLQNIRDEAHRFAITTHRKRREKIQ